MHKTGEDGTWVGWRPLGAAGGLMWAAQGPTGSGQTLQLLKGSLVIQSCEAERSASLASIPAPLICLHGMDAAGHGERAAPAPPPLAGALAGVWRRGTLCRSCWIPGARSLPPSMALELCCACGIWLSAASTLWAICRRASHPMYSWPVLAAVAARGAGHPC